MATASDSQASPASPGAARLTRLTGWSLIVIAAAHVAVFVPLAPWGKWFEGSLRGSGADAESLAVFWALPGGIAVPGFLLGLLLIRLGRMRQRVGVGFGLVLAGWASICLWLVGPSGFVAVLAAAGIPAAAIIDRRASRRSAVVAGRNGVAAGGDAREV
ncbi:hypothetical protein GCM10027447_14230 [Glycomyces halotolerans]